VEKDTTIDEKTRDYDYIDKYWEVLAACAWKEYRVHGRGALLCQIEEPGEEAVYLPLEMLTAHPHLKEYARMLEKYDPLEEVVLIFLRPPASVSAYKGGLSERGTPRQLYKRIKAVLSEN
jgi:hypothetical protein